MAFNDVTFDPTAKGNNLNSNFYAWFGKSKVTIKGKPRRVYHGSTFSFDSFSTSRSNPESAVGSGFYFSSTVHDINKNYATMKGPDLQGKIEQAMDALDYELGDDEKQDMIEKYLDDNNISFEDYNKNYKTRKDIEYEVFKPLLKDKVYGDSEGLIMPCYLRMEKPVYMGFGDKDTKFEYVENYDEENDEYDEPEGEGVEIIQYLQDNYGMNCDDLFSKATDYGYFTSKDLRDIMGESDVFMDADTSSGEVFSDIFCNHLDYDGVIQNASAFFGRKAGRGMKNIERAIHYIVYNPNQVKSVYNRGTWSRSSNKLTERDVK